MEEVNKHGLARYIPTDIRRQIRINSKFGCVLCRKGLYQYEHIDPEFKEAKEHSADAMCCLCGGCHDSVTRGQISKGAIKAAYSKIRSATLSEVAPPVGPLDFYDGNAELKIGNLLYSPAVHTVLRYHDRDIIRVTPGINGEPGRISATFTNDLGETILKLNENEWIGSLENWDIEITGPRITVRSALGRVALKIRLDPPGRLVLETLDMRIHSGHVIATEDTYAVGRYVSEDVVDWIYAPIKITKSLPTGTAIEFTTPEILDQRDKQFMNAGQELATIDRNMVMNSNVGVYVKSLGIAVASLCGSFQISEFVRGKRKISDVRNVIAKDPRKLFRFIGTGSIE